MNNEVFNSIIRQLLSDFLKENNITVNRFEEQHDLYSDTFNISITCACLEGGANKYEEDDTSKGN